jgi:hypothetical protein
VTGDLQALTDFTVTARFEIDSTVLDVHGPGGAQPVARLVKAGWIDRPVAYEMFTGAALDQLAGVVTPSGAVRPDGSTIGVVNLSNGLLPDRDIHPAGGLSQGARWLNPRRWRVVQPELPPLTGHAANIRTWLCFNAVTRFADWLGAGFLVTWPRVVFTMTFDFRGPDRHGFRITRPGWYRGRLRVRIDDARLDRRLVLACVAAAVICLIATPRRELLGAVRPFRNMAQPSRYRDPRRQPGADPPTRR